jgi:hypothetical protein
VAQQRLVLIFLVIHVAPKHQGLHPWQPTDAAFAAALSAHAPKELECWLAGKLLIMQDNVNSQLERCKVEITLSSLPADSSRAQARRRGALLSAAMCWIDSLQACTVNALIAPE